MKFKPHQQKSINFTGNQKEKGASYIYIWLHGWQEINEVEPSSKARISPICGGSSSGVLWQFMCTTWGEGVFWRNMLEYVCYSHFGPTSRWSSKAEPAFIKRLTVSLFLCDATNVHRMVETIPTGKQLAFGHPLNSQISSRKKYQPKDWQTTNNRWKELRHTDIKQLNFLRQATLVISRPGLVHGVSKSWSWLEPQRLECFPDLVAQNVWARHVLDRSPWVKKCYIHIGVYIYTCWQLLKANQQTRCAQSLIGVVNRTPPFNFVTSKRSSIHKQPGGFSAHAYNHTIKMFALPCMALSKWTSSGLDSKRSRNRNKSAAKSRDLAKNNS